MAISDKLNYLIETKRLFKDRLNSLGAEITSSTTFRNYLTWLDTFYGEVSDKTDLSVNGVVGRTSQDSAPSPNSPQQVNNLTGNVAYKITTQNGEQTFTIPLGDIELCAIDTYEDKIYSSDGRFYLNKNIGKVVLDGSESWGLWSTNVFYIPKISEIRKSFSNYYTFGETKETAGSLKNGEYCWSNAANGYTTLFKNTDIETAADFKTWLSTHNTTVYYVLATPTTTEITQENYPSLYNALKQIQDYLTAYKINKEFILGYSSPEIEY